MNNIQKIPSFVNSVFFSNQFKQWFVAIALTFCLFCANQVVAGGMDLGFGEGRVFVKGLMQGDFGATIALIGLLCGGVAMLWWNWKVGASVIVILCLYLFLPDGIESRFTSTF